MLLDRCGEDVVVRIRLTAWASELHAHGGEVLLTSLWTVEDALTHEHQRSCRRGEIAELRLPLEGVFELGEVVAMAIPVHATFFFLIAQVVVTQLRVVTGQEVNAVNQSRTCTRAPSDDGNLVPTNPAACVGLLVCVITPAAAPAGNNPRACRCSSAAPMSRLRPTIRPGRFDAYRSSRQARAICRESVCQRYRRRRKYVLIGPARTSYICVKRCFAHCSCIAQRTGPRPSRAGRGDDPRHCRSSARSCRCRASLG